MGTSEFRSRLARRARRAGVSISTDLFAKLETYYKLLTVWNNKINLTGLDLSDGSAEALDRLLIEPIAAAKYVPAGTTRMLDIGSGGGSPALPLALALPQARLVMVESKTRKSVFLREAVRALGLTQAEVVTARVEELLSRPDLHETQDLVTIRAVKIDPAMFMTLQAFTRPGGLVFLFQSSTASDPIQQITPLLSPTAIHQLLESLRSHLVVLTKN